MTCIVGLETSEGVLIGADSFVGSSGFADIGAPSKIIRRNGWLVGVSGSSRIATILAHLFPWPKAPARPDDGAVARLSAELGKVLAHDDLCLSNEHGQRTLTMELLVAAGGRLHSIGAALGVFRSRNGYLAAGSGEQYALGSLASTVGQAPKVRALTALRAAALHCPTVRGPFRFSETRMSKV
jgi:ATP-dependent protease HslVU (ClpYQ) peptidase subunit